MSAGQGTGPDDAATGSGLPAAVVQGLLQRGLSVATAESLTAGMVAAALAEVPGASGTLQGGVIAYQNRIKEQLLGVDAGLLARRGAVDPEVAVQMAAGARRALGADIGLATTGVAGPEPHQGQPVGTVYLGISADGRSGWGPDRALTLQLPGDRAAIRAGTVHALLQAVVELLAGREVDCLDS